MKQNEEKYYVKLTIYKPTQDAKDCQMPFPYPVKAIFKC